MTTEKVPMKTEIVLMPSDDLKRMIREVVGEEFSLFGKSTAQLPPADPVPPLSRIKAAQYLSVSLPTLDDLARRGEIKSCRVATRLRFRFKDLEDYLNK
jgi:excisionase family DNA binding protein